MNSNTARCAADPKRGREFGRASRRLRLCSPSGGKRAKAGLSAVQKNGNGRGLLSSLAGMPGARAKTQERVEFEVTEVQKVITSIREMAGTGALTIHFLEGKPSGIAQWETPPKPTRD